MQGPRTKTLPRSNVNEVGVIKFYAHIFFAENSHGSQSIYRFSKHVGNCEVDIVSYAAAFENCILPEISFVSEAATKFVHN